MQVNRLGFARKLFHRRVEHGVENLFVIDDAVRVFTDDPRHSLERARHRLVHVRLLQKRRVEQERGQDADGRFANHLDAQAHVGDLFADERSVRRARHANEIGEDGEVPHKVRDQRVTLGHANVHHAQHELVAEALIRLAHRVHQVRRRVDERSLRHQSAHNLQRAVLNVGILVIKTLEDVTLVLGDDSRMRIEQKRQRVKR